MKITEACVTKYSGMAIALLALSLAACSKQPDVPPMPVDQPVPAMPAADATAPALTSGVEGTLSSPLSASAPAPAPGMAMEAEPAETAKK